MPLSTSNSNEPATASKMPSSKQYALALLLLVASAFAFDRLGAQAIHFLVLQSQFRYSRLYGSEKMDNQLIFIGNSRGVNSFYVPCVEKNLSRSAINLSYNGLSMGMMEIFLKDYLERHEKPEIIFVEITGGGGSPQRNTIFLDDSKRLRTLYRSQSPKAFGYTDVSHLYRFNDEQLFRILYYIGRTDQTWINRYALSPELVDQARNDPTPVRLGISLESLSALSRIDKLLAEEGIAVRYIIAPYMPAWRNRIANMEEFKQQIGSVLRKGTPICDYSDALNENAYFADRIHTNLTGAVPLFEIMRADGLFDLNR
jgi:hypothetical protein